MFTRHLSKVSRPLQRAKQVEQASKTAAQQHKKEEKAVDTAESDPWSHFAAFNSMDDYVDVTLIRYNKKEKEDNEDEKV
ncbi:unnamed protein product [Phytophthora lilii]|uniref:Unnamed protein product n=1 Tax=Phytophthora lilii TaxID=2077276 RepID=A0A9W6TUH7_9STRA|nr:unnamed protein product [Phytophthora lilii]